jgi:ubiquinone/menaquinone biosynthesis C-methylase UbiE
MNMSEVNSHRWSYYNDSVEPLYVLNEVLTHNYVARLLDDDIYSVLPEASQPHHYDRRATVYDCVVGSRLYNSIMWGSAPRDYVAFARQAIESSDDGTFLDAGCGSLLFTASTYLETDRQVIAFDQSLAMLRRARTRLSKAAGRVPQNIILLQADLTDLPFRPSSFRTALCLNVLHQFGAAKELLQNLERLLTDEGHLFLTSLISNDRFIGDRYLSTLYRLREFVPPRTRAQLQSILNEAFQREITYMEKGNMAFVKCVSG